MNVALLPMLLSLVEPAPEEAPASPEVEAAADTETAAETPVATEDATAEVNAPADPTGEAPDEPSETSEPVVDNRAALPTVEMSNTAGTPVPTSRPNAFPSRERKKGRGRVQRRNLSSRGGGDDQDQGGDWGFDFHGYIRAPMRLGVGQRDEPAEGQSERTLHYPVIPDDQYLSYQYTQHNPRDWSELYFSYGNSVATGTVSLQGFNFTDAAWKEDNAQFGIAQGFVTLTPNLKAKNVRLMWKIGSFDNRYGSAGRYDAGELDTYLFGRTHAIGEAGEVEFLLKDFTLSFEHGIGTSRPDPRIFNTARFTFLHHGHVGLSYRDNIEVGTHYLQALAREEDRDGEQNVDAPDGTMTVVGPDLRVDWGKIGYLYAGFSYIKAVSAGVVGPAIEVIHSRGGGQFTFGIVDNYLNSPQRASNGNGEIYSVMAQYEQSVRRVLEGDSFYGQGMDFSLKLYGMFNKVASDDPDVDGVLKMKYGINGLFSALSWFGVGARYDRVQPNSRVPEQSFAVVSPRMVFRTAWLSREEISLQYSRYMYNVRNCDMGGDAELCVQPPSAAVPPDGFGTTTGNQDSGNRGAPTRIPDQDVFMIRATFWW
ncbi:MAG: hypothetical protein ACRBN8_32885 [Nannocystales bacterium]